MQKIRIFFFLFLFPSILFAQQRTKIILQESQEAVIDNKTNITHVKKPVFEHDRAILTCDSARFYTQLNYFEAFGNVHINQGDTIHIYSDQLNYDGNQKLAHLINNVRMSDPSTTLTTNVFDYNMGTKIGTYIQNGKIVNKSKETTITSKNGYYFSNTKDAYFRYNVIVKSEKATITSDTLRYNTATNWTYFYGPTDIKGKDDNLYTENGAYNTKDENAYFGKKNLYTQGSKTLKGDSLYYYGKRGYGKAVKNITFTDSEDKLLLKGQLGEYYKEGERIVVTKNAYVGMGTADSITVNNKLVPDTLWLGADILEAQMVLQKTVKLIPTPTVLADDEIGEEEERAKKNTDLTDAIKVEPKKGVGPASTKPSQTRKDKSDQEADPIKAKKPEGLNITIPADSVKPLLKDLTKKDSLVKDSLAKNLLTEASKVTLANSIKSPKGELTKKIATETGKINLTPSKVETVKATTPVNPADTVRTRTIKAFHNVRVFKSNLQAKSDSLYFAAADSTLRWYQQPMIWSDQTQQTGDTIYVQFKQKKINTIQVLQNAFIVNAEPDTTKFNQIKGKIITGFFNNGEMKNLFVDGNAESIYYTKDSKDAYNNLNQTVSARIKVIFEDKELSRIKTVKQVEGTFTPIDKLPNESLLTGFIWKPELRPKSKEDIIKGIGSSSVKAKATPITPKKPAEKPSKTVSPPQKTGSKGKLTQKN